MGGAEGVGDFRTQIQKLIRLQRTMTQPFLQRFDPAGHSITINGWPSNSPMS